MRLAIFDFDGTITNTDSFIDFHAQNGPAVHPQKNQRITLKPYFTNSLSRCIVHYYD